MESLSLKAYKPFDPAKAFGWHRNNPIPVKTPEDVTTYLNSLVYHTHSRIIAKISGVIGKIHYFAIRDNQGKYLGELFFYVAEGNSIKYNLPSGFIQSKYAKTDTSNIYLGESFYNQYFDDSSRDILFRFRKLMGFFPLDTNRMDAELSMLFEDMGFYEYEKIHMLLDIMNTCLERASQGGLIKGDYISGLKNCNHVNLSTLQLEILLKFTMKRAFSIAKDKEMKPGKVEEFLLNNGYVPERTHVLESFSSTIDKYIDNYPYVHYVNGYAGDIRFYTDDNKEFHIVNDDLFNNTTSSNVYLFLMYTKKYNRSLFYSICIKFATHIPVSESYKYLNKKLRIEKFQSISEYEAITLCNIVSAISAFVDIVTSAYNKVLMDEFKKDKQGRYLFEKATKLYGPIDKLDENSFANLTTEDFAYYIAYMIQSDLQRANSALKGEEFLPEKESKYPIAVPSCPHEQYVSSGEYILPVMTEASFDLLISMNDLNADEIDAFSSSPIKVFMKSFDGIPFLVFKFGDEFKIDFSINIKKIKEEYLKDWLNNRAQNVTLYLFEGSDASLQCTRIIQFEGMCNIRNVVTEQLKLTTEEIDTRINAVKERTTVADIIREATIIFKIKEPEIEL